MNLITVSGVKGYIDENETAWLNLEDTARGLGFTTVATSGNDCVRWTRVYEYLNSFPFTTTERKTIFGVNGFIPENIFYRLAMKARNEVAEAFQAKVADEILPSIRKTGSYSVQPKSMMLEDVLIAQLQAMKEVKLIQQQQSATITDHEFKLATLDQKVREEITLTTREQKQIQGAVNRRSFDIGLPDSYRQIYGALKKHFQIPSYRDLKRSDLTKAFEFIRCWSPRIQ